MKPVFSHWALFCGCSVMLIECLASPQGGARGHHAFHSYNKHLRNSINVCPKTKKNNNKTINTIRKLSKSYLKPVVAAGPTGNRLLSRLPPEHGDVLMFLNQNGCGFRDSKEFPCELVDFQLTLPARVASWFAAQGCLKSSQPSVQVDCQRPTNFPGSFQRSREHRNAAAHNWHVTAKVHFISFSIPLMKVSFPALQLVKYIFD